MVELEGPRTSSETQKNLREKGRTSGLSVPSARIGKSEMEMNSWGGPRVRSPVTLEQDGEMLERTGGSSENREILKRIETPAESNSRA